MHPRETCEAADVRATSPLAAPMTHQAMRAFGHSTRVRESLTSPPTSPPETPLGWRSLDNRG